MEVDRVFPENRKNEIDSGSTDIYNRFVRDEIAEGDPPLFPLVLLGNRLLTQGKFRRASSITEVSS